MAEENTSTSTGDAAQTALEPENATQGATPEIVTGGGFAEDLCYGNVSQCRSRGKSVMIGLLLASIVTWALFFAKGSYLLALRRRLRNESAQLVEAKSSKRH